MMTYC